MSSYKCETCEKQFNRKSNYEYHIKNKSCKNRLYICLYCDKEFTTKTNMYRHIRLNCKIKKSKDDEKDTIYNELIKLNGMTKLIMEENVKLKKEMNGIKQNMVKYNVNINNGTTNINNGTVNQITLVGYGNEDISKIEKKDILKVLQNGFYTPIKLTETLHFNPKYPEYHNIYISNIKDKYAMLFDGVNWTLTMKEDLINRIYEDKKNYIEENLDEFIDSLPLSRRKALERWLETDDENSKITEIKDQIKLLLYNKRNIPLETQSMIENNYIEETECHT